MTVHLSCYPGEVFVQCPAVSADGGTEGMLRQIVRPKEDFYGYDVLRKRGDGKHDLEANASGRPSC
jgi:hypothetical protein